MALLNNSSLDFKRNRQFQSLIDVLQESIPENALLQGKLSDLTSSKGSYIKQLIKEWDERDQPDYDEEEIRQMNIMLEIKLRKHQTWKQEMNIEQWLQVKIGF